MKYIPVRTDDFVHAIIARDAGISYENIVSGRGVYSEITPKQFYRAVKQMEKFVPFTTGRKRQTLEAIATNPERRNNLLFMGEKILRRQYDCIFGRISGETQKEYFDGTVRNPMNVQELIYYNLSSNFDGLGSLNREEVIKGVKTFCETYFNKGADRSYLSEIGLEMLMQHGFGKGETKSPFYMLMAFDKAYQLRTGDASLFALDQECHLHEWELPFPVPFKYLRNENNSKRIVYHMLTDEVPELKLDNRDELLDTVSSLPNGLKRFFEDIGLGSIINHAFKDRKDKGPLGVLTIFDEAQKDRTGNAGLFDANQPRYLSKHAYGRRGSKAKSWTPIRKNRIFYPQCTNNGTLITMQDFAQEVYAAVAEGSSVSLPTILTVAAQTGETPRLVLDSRDAFPLRWHDLIEGCGINYEKQVYPQQSNGDGRINGKSNGGNGKNGADNGNGDSLEVKLGPWISSDDIIFQPLSCKERIEEILVDDYKPDEYPICGVNYAGRNIHVYRNTIAEIPVLTRAQERKIGMDIKHHEQSARIALQEGDIITFERHRVSWGRVVNYLFESNLKFAFKQANKRYDKSRHESGADLGYLVQEANYAIRRAAEKFDYRFGTKFLSYAGWYIKLALDEAVNEHKKVVKLPRDLIHRKTVIYREQGRLEAMNGSTSSTVDLSEEIQLSPKVIEQAERIALYDDSLDAPLGDERNSSTKIDLIAQEREVLPGTNLETIQSFGEIEEVLESCTLWPSNHPLHMTPREELVLRQRYGVEGSGVEGIGSQGIGRGFAVRIRPDIGNDLKCSRETIRLIEVDAIEKLRAALMAADVVPQITKQTTVQPAVN
jgi:RNA polymerase sigma factor (sigma-70 family)